MAAWTAIGNFVLDQLYSYQDVNELKENAIYIKEAVWDGSSDVIAVAATKKLYLDGGGNTYIYESAADILSIFAGGTEKIKCNHGAALISLLNPVAIPSTDKLYLDGGNDTYIYESAADVVKMYIGGVETIGFSNNYFAVDGTVEFTNGQVDILDDYSGNLLEVTNNLGSGANVGIYGRCDSGIGIEGRGSAGSWDFYANGAGGNYGPFTGGHETLIKRDIAKDLKQGMIVSSNGKVKKREGSISSTMPMIELSNIKNDANIFGVFSTIQEDDWVYRDKIKKIKLKRKEYEYEDRWYDVGENETIANANALGEGRVLVTNKNGEVNNGDLITSSDIAGYGQKQDDDLFHSYTVAKATEDVDWSKIKDNIEGYKYYLIACTYHCG